jgi:lipopolysaccharide transport system ATP-binding protein
VSTVIEVDGVWKKYRLGVLGTGTLRHDVERWWHRIRGKPDPYSEVDQTTKVKSRKSKEDPNGESGGDLSDDEMWALRGVSVEMKQGEILGIIGRNGAGKSTLLKILSRVTSPTKGEVRVKGRIASLLEVGTGFHPELTGRENTFLNGAILGMSRSEIKMKFDEIVTFAGIDSYIDTPVKRYSSGMYVRLAFAVAAHLESEILIVDEVLAVGDVEFQKKCLGKMSEVAHGGRTVLFVSHNLSSICTLCDRAAHLHGGSLIDTGVPAAVVDRYLKALTSKTYGHTVNFAKPVTLETWIESASLLVNGKPGTIAQTGDSLAIRASFNGSRPVRTLLFGVLVSTVQGDRVLSTNNSFLPWNGPKSAVQQGTITCDLGPVPLMEGAYRISIWYGNHSHHLQHEPNVLGFDLHARNIWGTQHTLPQHFSLLWWDAKFHLDPAS